MDLISIIIDIVLFVIFIILIISVIKIQSNTRRTMELQEEATGYLKMLVSRSK